MKKSYIMIVAILCLGIFLTACQSPEQEKPIYGGSFLLGQYSINDLVDDGVCAFYGKITGKSEEVFEHWTSPDDTYAWLYHEVYVEVLECWQSADGLEVGDTFTYGELGGENKEYKFIIEDVPIYSVGDYVIIMAHENTFMTSDRIMKLEDGRVEPPLYQLRDNPSTAKVYEEFKESGKRGEAVTFTVEEFAALVKEAQEN